MAGFPSRAKGNAKGEGPSKQPRPGVPFDKSVVLKLLHEEHGNLSRIADRIGTTRSSLRRFIDRDPELVEAKEDSRERLIDTLEDSIWNDAVETRDTALRCFILKTQGRHRGWDQDEAKNAAKDIATAAFDFIISKTNNPQHNKS
jgi:hypothetical protein